MQGSTFRCRQGVSFRLPLTTHDTSRLTSLRLGGCDPALSLAVRAAPRDDGLTDPTMGLMRSVMPGRLPDYRGWEAERRCGPPVSEVSGRNSPSSCAAPTDI